MSKGYTEIVYILDRSGSMGGLEADTIGGFNSMMEKQKKTGEKAVVSTVLFDDECEVLHDRISIDRVEKMTDEDYYVRGCTALLDAVGAQSIILEMYISMLGQKIDQRRQYLLLLLMEWKMQVAIILMIRCKRW